MRTLEFFVRKQVVHWENPCKKPIELSRGVVFADFGFDDEWDALSITVVFTHEILQESVSVIWTGEPIPVPPEVLHHGRVFVSAVGYGAAGNVRLTTKRMDQPIFVLQAGDIEGAAPENTAPELWEQVISIVGGYYIPHIAEDGTLSWSANRDGMPEIPEQNIKGPSGVYIGSGEMPEGYNVQIDPNGLPTEDRGKLVYIDKDGVWSPLSLGPGLKIANGVLMLDGGMAAASAILGSALVGSAVVGNGG